MRERQVPELACKVCLCDPKDVARAVAEGTVSSGRRLGAGPFQLRLHVRMMMMNCEWRQLDSSTHSQLFQHCKDPMIDGPGRKSSAPSRWTSLHRVSPARPRLHDVPYPKAAPAVPLEPV
jgi:hypothetical protein